MPGSLSGDPDLCRAEPCSAAVRAVRDESSMARLYKRIHAWRGSTGAGAVHLASPAAEGIHQQLHVQHHDHQRDHPGNRRSEEHTSELQSQSNLVCRLLLEKKKNDTALDNSSTVTGTASD